MKKILYILILTLLWGCGPNEIVKFESPQPENVKVISNFNSKIQGEYSTGGNPQKTLIIDQSIVRSIKTYTMSCLRQELEIDSALKVDLNNDKELIDLMNSEGGTTTIRNDSVFHVNIHKDTLFDSNINVLKRLRNNYYLNYKLDSYFWTVKKMYLKKDTLYIGAISPGDTLLHFGFSELEQEMNKDDSGNVTVTTKEYILTPNKKEFKRLVKSGAFETTEKYYKIQ